MMVGDAIGLPTEGLSPARRKRLFGELTDHRLFRGRGMVSDDTAHAIMTAQALVASGGDPERFGRELAGRLRLWFLSLPPGMGLATVRACLKLLIGFPHTQSGVFSAGNGPAMRAPIIGVFCADDASDHRLRALIRVSTRITHTDPKAHWKSPKPRRNPPSRSRREPGGGYSLARSPAISSQRWKRPCHLSHSTPLTCEPRL